MGREFEDVLGERYDIVAADAVGRRVCRVCVCLVCVYRVCVCRVCVCDLFEDAVADEDDRDYSDGRERGIEGDRRDGGWLRLSGGLIDIEIAYIEYRYMVVSDRRGFDRVKGVCCPPIVKAHGPVGMATGEVEG